MAVETGVMSFLEEPVPEVAPVSTSKPGQSGGRGGWKGNDKKKGALGETRRRDW